MLWLFCGRLCCIWWVKKPLWGNLFGILFRTVGQSLKTRMRNSLVKDQLCVNIMCIIEVVKIWKRGHSNSQNLCQSVRRIFSGHLTGKKIFHTSSFTYIKLNHLLWSECMRKSCFCNWQNDVIDVFYTVQRNLQDGSRFYST